MTKTSVAREVSEDALETLAMLCGIAAILLLLILTGIWLAYIGDSAAKNRVARAMPECRCQCGCGATTTQSTLPTK